MHNIMHNLRRQKEVSRVRMNRIINGYIEIKHPEIYEEAKAFYSKLNMLYPKKKDLRKTYEYSLFATGSRDNKYKYNRASQEEISDKMVLEIPLMDMSGVPTVPPTVIPAIAADIPTDAPAIPTVAPTVIPDIGAELTLPVVPDNIIDGIITELRQDPEICNFFDDILNDETPLESELTALGF